MKWYYSVGIIFLVILGIVTLVPANASKPNLLGYYSIGPFAPVTAIVLWIIAGEIYWFGKQNKKKSSQVSYF